MAFNHSSSSFVGQLMHLTYDLRAMFYLLAPQETYYEFKEEVPDVTLNVTTLFYSFIFVEQILHLFYNGRFNGSMSDTIGSLSAGMMSLLPNFLVRKINIIAYEWVYENWRICDLPWNSFWTYIIALLFVDFLYYWVHRVAHEINIFWAGHQTHHSSEEYNLSTALRQTGIQPYTTWFIYLPLAFFLRPSVYIMHSHLNLIYQFWIHTELIDSCGPLEYIMNTPSHHRVHHGRNPYCIDKNYAGVFIIWDRIFGTFEPERKEEKIAYGLVSPIKSFDPIYVQTFLYVDVLKRALSAKTFSEAFCILFKGPGWQPGSPRLGYPNSVPPVIYPHKKLSSSISALLNIYVGVHFLFSSIFFGETAKLADNFPSIVVSMLVAFFIFNLTCYGRIFDAKSDSLFLEAFRCLSFLILDHYYGPFIKRLLYDSNYLYKLFKWYFSISCNLMFIIAVRDFAQRQVKLNWFRKMENENKSIIKKKAQ